MCYNGVFGVLSQVAKINIRHFTSKKTYIKTIDVNKTGMCQSFAEP